MIATETAMKRRLKQRLQKSNKTTQIADMSQLASFETYGNSSSSQL
jgi:hypothetical protein